MCYLKERVFFAGAFRPAMETSVAEGVRVAAIRQWPYRASSRQILNALEEA
jgi:hypothetical protein